MEELRVVAYARVSSKEQAEKELSIPAQLKAIRKYCQDAYQLISLWRSLCDNCSSSISSFWPHINDIIRRFNHIQIMFYYNYCISTLYQPLKNTRQPMNFSKMQPG